VFSPKVAFLIGPPDRSLAPDEVVGHTPQPRFDLALCCGLRHRQKRRAGDNLGGNGAGESLEFGQRRPASSSSLGRRIASPSRAGKQSTA
jgi:hypothetical protein